MKRTAFAILILGTAMVIGAPPSPARAQPANDDFPGTTITSLPFTDTVDTTGATDEQGEPFCSANQGLAVWYRYAPKENTTLVLDLQGSAYDVFASVYSGDSLDDLVCRGSGHTDRVGAVEVQGGQTYHIQAGSAAASPTTGTLELTVREPDRPANDDFPGTTIENLPFRDTVSTAFSTDDGSTSVVGPTVWYNYTPRQDIELWADTFGSDFPAIIDLRDLDGNHPSGAGADYYDCEVLDQGVYYEAKAGETLYFQVGGVPIGSTGNLIFHLEEYGPDSPDLACYGELGPPYTGYTQQEERPGSQTPTPEPEPASESTSDDGTDGWLMFIAGGLVVFGIVLAVTVVRSLRSSSR